MRKSHKNKLLINIFVVVAIFGGIILMMDQCFKSNARIEEQKDNSIYIGWRSPTSEEIGKISVILGSNNISGCGEYRVGEYKGETKIACSSDGSNWVYYDIWEHSEDVNKTPTDQSARFNKPN